MAQTLNIVSLLLSPAIQETGTGVLAFSITTGIITITPPGV
ncbi:hypothetical protein [Rufibacter aurantiacus]|nr:hypothetical protein [Rufibacter aurantiacus]